MDGFFGESRSSIQSVVDGPRRIREAVPDQGRFSAVLGPHDHQIEMGSLVVFGVGGADGMGGMGQVELANGLPNGDVLGLIEPFLRVFVVHMICATN